jgi:nucleotide-binding universal stress UspA family protein
MFKRILVPLDGSRRAEQAIPLAARIAHSSGSSMVVMQAAWMPQGVAGALGPALFSPELFLRDQADIAAYLACLAASSPLKDLPTEREVADGEPAHAILAAAQAHQADLIVMTSHGRTGLARALLGSVAARVARASTIPVLIVRGGNTDMEKPLQEPLQGGRPVQILVALDGSSFAEAALSPAANLSTALSAPLPGALHLVRVLPLIETDAMTRVRKTQAIEEATAYLNQVTRRLRGIGEATSPLQVLSSVVVDASDIAGALAHVAASLEDEGVCALIALSTHGRKGWERLVAGSVTERVLAATRWPILVVHPPHQARIGEIGTVVAQEALPRWASARPSLLCWSRAASRARGWGPSCCTGS